MLLQIVFCLHLNFVTFLHLERTGTRRVRRDRLPPFAIDTDTSVLAVNGRRFAGYLVIDKDFHAYCSVVALTVSFKIGLCGEKFTDGGLRRVQG
jgi:hypothetical protein